MTKVTMKMKQPLYLCLIAIIFLFSVEVSAAAEEEVSKGYRQMTIKMEGLLRDILKEFKDNNIWMAIRHSKGVFDNDDLPVERDAIQFFDEPYRHKLTSALPQYGYCAGSFEIAKMNFDPKPIDSSGEAYVFFVCGPFIKFNCDQKCRIDVRAGRWGQEERNYGKTLYIDHYRKGKKEVKHLKEDLQNAILEAAKSLFDPGESYGVLSGGM